MSINIISSDWYTTTHTFNDNTFCEIHLKITGYSNAALLSITTYSDGINGCEEIKCDANNKFSADFMICFFPKNAYPEQKYGTVLTAYSSRNKPLAFYCDAVGSGDTIRKLIDSPWMICN